MKSKIEGRIIDAIDNANYKRKDIAELYSEALVISGNGFDIDFKKINKKIIKRWSVSGLEYIKRMAWKPYKG